MGRSRTGNQGVNTDREADKLGAVIQDISRYNLQLAALSAFLVGLGVAGLLVDFVTTRVAVSAIAFGVAGLIASYVLTHFARFVEVREGRQSPDEAIHSTRRLVVEGSLLALLAIAAAILNIPSRQFVPLLVAVLAMMIVFDVFEVTFRSRERKRRGK